MSPIGVAKDTEWISVVMSLQTGCLALPFPFQERGLSVGHETNTSRHQTLEVPLDPAPWILSP